MQDINTKRKNGLSKISSALLRAVIILSSLLSFHFTSYANKESTKTIAITAIVEHPSLQEAKRGIIDSLKKAGYESGKNLKIIEQNAQGNISNAALIAKNFVAMKPGAIVAISTPSAQSVVNAARNSDIPIVISSVTDPISAGIVASLESNEKRMTGAIDFPKIKEEIEFILSIVPNAKKIGLLYNPGEANATKTIELMKVALREYFLIVEAVAQNSNQVSSAVKSLIGKVDVVYIPSDNTIFSSMAKVVEITRENKLPLFSSDPDSVKQGVLGCVGYTQYAVGVEAGNALVEILKNNKIIPIKTPDMIEIFMNEESARLLNIEIPVEILGIKVKKV